MHKEEKLLLNCIKDEPSEYDIDAIEKALQGKLNWNYLVDVAKRSKIVPLFFNNLRKNRLEILLPNQIRSELEKVYFAIGLQNTCYFRELKGILNTFSIDGIDFIVLKGAALAEEVWGNVALRQMSDIDILVRKKDLVAAEKK